MLNSEKNDQSSYKVQFFFAIIGSITTIIAAFIASPYFGQLFQADVQNISEKLIAGVTASSILKSQTYQGKTRTYIPINVIDGDESTAWVEGVSNHGIDEWVKVSFKEKVLIKSISIVGAYGADNFRYKINNRIKKIEIIFSGDLPSKVKYLEDNIDSQEIKLEVPHITKWVKFKILEIYEGTKYKDTPISEIYFE